MRSTDTSLEAHARQVAVYRAMSPDQRVSMAVAMSEDVHTINCTCDGSLIRSRSSSCFAWLSANAARFGLYNLPSEPWHWSVDGS